MLTLISVCLNYSGARTNRARDESRGTKAQRWRIHTELLLKPKHDVQIPQRLASSTLDQVIDHRQYHDGIAALRTMYSDTADVRAPHRTRLGVTARGHDVHERFVCVALLEHGLKIHVFALEARVKRGMDTA